MRLHKILLVSFFMLLCSCVYAQEEGTVDTAAYSPPPTYEELLKWDEQFTYTVKYAFFRLGNVQVEVLRDTLDGQMRWRLRTIITSNSAIPFVGEEENHYHSIFSTVSRFLTEFEFWRDNVDEKEFKDSHYLFDWENSKVYAREAGLGADTLDLEKSGGSGHLVFMISRTFAGSDSYFKIPIYTDLEKGSLDLKSSRKTEFREYEAFDEPVKTYVSEGKANLEGPFGFSGHFKAWYLADELRVPLESHLQVWLGNVKIKLINYIKRPRK